MQYQVRVDDGESSVVVESFDDLAQAIDCYVLQILALTQASSGQREQTVNLPAYAFGGSNPSLPTVRECSSMVEPQPSKLVMSVRSRSLARVACVAQSVEHFLGKEEVTGSSPVMSSMISNFFREAKNGKRKV